MFDEFGKQDGVKCGGNLADIEAFRGKAGNPNNTLKTNGYVFVEG